MLNGGVSRVLSLFSKITALNTVSESSSYPGSIWTAISRSWWAPESWACLAYHPRMQGPDGRVKSESCHNARRTLRWSGSRQMSVWRASQWRCLGGPEMWSPSSRSAERSDWQILQIWENMGRWSGMDTGPTNAPDSFYGPDAGQDHLLQSPLPSRQELAHLDVKFPVATKLVEGVHVAHADELGVPWVIPHRDGLKLQWGIGIGQPGMSVIFHQRKQHFHQLSHSFVQHISVLLELLPFVTVHHGQRHRSKVNVANLTILPSMNTSGLLWAVQWFKKRIDNPIFCSFTGHSLSQHSHRIPIFPPGIFCSRLSRDLELSHSLCCWELWLMGTIYETAGIIFFQTGSQIRDWRNLVLG